MSHLESSWSHHGVIFESSWNRGQESRPGILESWNRGLAWNRGEIPKTRKASQILPRTRNHAETSGGGDAEVRLETFSTRIRPQKI